MVCVLFFIPRFSICILIGCIAAVAALFPIPNNNNDYTYLIIL